MTPDGSGYETLWRRGDSSDDGGAPASTDITFFSHVPQARILLRYSRVLVFGVYFCLLLGFELFTDEGPWQLVPAVPGNVFVLAGLGIWSLVMFLLLGTFYKFLYGIGSEQMRLRESLWRLVKAAGRILGLLALVSGTAVSMVTVTFATPTSVEPNVIHVSGFFLLLYVAGPLVYDGMLRTEHLFNNFERLDIVASSQSSAALDSVRANAHETLTHHLPGKRFVPLPTIPTMAVAFVLLFTASWHFGDGPFNLDHPATLLASSLFDVLIASLAIQFVVIIRLLHTLLRNDSESPPAIEYRPFHADTAAGFRDLGAFATRANTLMTLAMGYLVYRLYVHGRLSVMLDGQTFGLSTITLAWFVNYLLPVIVFGVVLVLWIYFSFWRLHQAMKRSKRRLLATATPGNPVSREISEWRAIRDGPVWPINDRLLVALLSADLVSLGIAVTALLS